MKESILKEFNYQLESDAILDVFSTIGEEEVNNDNFEVLTNKNLNVLILASGERRDQMGDIVSKMASSEALELLDNFNFNKKSSNEILDFLKKSIFDINNFIVEYLETANIPNCSTSLSIAVIYKNSFFTAHIGKNRIYVIPKDETPTLLSKDPSYSKKISSSTDSSQEKSNYLGDKELDETNFFVRQEADLYHNERVFISSPHMTEYLPENKFLRPIEEIESHLSSYPPLQNASFIRYVHYERRVEVLRINKEEIDEFNYESGMLDFNIDWQKILPTLKKVALALGILIIVIFVYGLIESTPETTIKTEERKNLIPIDENKIVSLPLVKKEIETKLTAELIPPKLEYKRPEPKKLEPMVIKEKEIKEAVKIELSSLKLLKKAESDILNVEEGLRITFKENQLIASKAESFYHKGANQSRLYCKISNKNSEVKGEIIKLLTKQNFANSVVVSNHNNSSTINIKIKNSCNYTRSQWAKKSNLDLLTFKCEP